MKDFRICGWLLSYNLSKISSKLAISPKHNIIFAKFLEILLDINVTSSLTHIRWWSKNHLEVIWVYIFRFCINQTVSISPNCFLKMHLKNSTRLGFRWLKKSVETIKLDNRSFCRCYSLCFYISVLDLNHKIDLCYFLMIIWKHFQGKYCESLQAADSGSPRRLAATELIYCWQSKRYVQNNAGNQKQPPSSFLQK